MQTDSLSTLIRRILGSRIVLRDATDDALDALVTGILGEQVPQNAVSSLGPDSLVRSDEDAVR